MEGGREERRGREGEKGRKRGRVINNAVCTCFVTYMYIYTTCIFHHLFSGKKNLSPESIPTAKAGVKCKLIEEAAQTHWYFTTLYHITESSVAPDSTHFGVGHLGVVMGRLEACKKGGNYLKPLAEIR